MPFYAPSDQMDFILGWSLKHVDMTAAFLNRKIYRSRYLQFPYNLPRCRLTGLMYCFRKSLYELKQAPRLWCRNLKYFLVPNITYKRHTWDCSVFVKHNNFGTIIIWPRWKIWYSFQVDSKNWMQTWFSSWKSSKGLRSRLTITWGAYPF